MDERNPFKAIELDAHCPPRLKGEIISEIDLIRNALQVVEVYGYYIFSAFTIFLSELVPNQEKHP